VGVTHIRHEGSVLALDRASRISLADSQGLRIPCERPSSLPRRRGGDHASQVEMSTLARTAAMCPEGVTPV
jgi:hypothetical protein